MMSDHNAACEAVLRDSAAGRPGSLPPDTGQP